MTRVILCALLLSLTPVLEAEEDRPVRAKYLITVADDFVVNVYHNGRYVPDSRRTLALERFGATVEKIDIEVRDGDWLVFNVVNNRLRWGGAYYFAVAGCLAQNEFGFVSRLDTADWSACDDLSEVDRFISERTHLQHRRAVAVTRPWHEGTKFMRRYAGKDWDGTSVWGTRKNTWIKVLVGEAPTGSTAERSEEKPAALVEGTSWGRSAESSTPSLTFRADGVVQGASTAVRGRWYAINNRTVIAEWKTRIYVIDFEDDMKSARVYRKGKNWRITRTAPRTEARTRISERKREPSRLSPRA